MIEFLFFVMAAFVLCFSVGVIISKSPMHSALSMVGATLSLAVIYLLHGAEFVFAVQIIVFTGAVMTMIIFVIMLLDLEKERNRGRTSGTKILGSIAAGLLFLLVLAPSGARLANVVGGVAENIPVAWGSIENFAEKLFKVYLLAFELVSIFLLVGLIGAVIIARKKTPAE